MVADVGQAGVGHLDDVDALLERVGFVASLSSEVAHPHLDFLVFGGTDDQHGVFAGLEPDAGGVFKLAVAAGLEASGQRLHRLKRPAYAEAFFGAKAPGQQFAGGVAQHRIRHGFDARRTDPRLETEERAIGEEGGVRSGEVRRRQRGRGGLLGEQERCDEREEEKESHGTAEVRTAKGRNGWAKLS